MRINGNSWFCTLLVAEQEAVLELLKRWTIIKASAEDLVCVPWSCFLVSGTSALPPAGIRL